MTQKKNKIYKIPKILEKQSKFMKYSKYYFWLMVTAILGVGIIIVAAIGVMVAGKFQ